MNVSEGRRYTLEYLDGAEPGASGSELAGAFPIGAWSVAADRFLVGEPLGETTHFFTNVLPTDATAPKSRFYRVRIDR